MAAAMKSTLRAALKSGHCLGEKLEAADRTWLKSWADHCADDPVWDEIISDARNLGLWPEDSLYSELILYAVDARRIAQSIKGGIDFHLREKKNQRADLMALAAKAKDLARYFGDAEKHSGVAMFYQRFLQLPVTPEQQRVFRIEQPFLRIRQLREIHEREAELLRQRAGRVPQPTTFISRSKSKRPIIAFIHLMTGNMREFCGKPHPHAVALLASMAFNTLVDKEDVRAALRPSTRKGRRR